MDKSARDAAKTALLAGSDAAARAIQLERQGKNGEALKVWRNDVFGHGVFSHDLRWYATEAVNWLKKLVPLYEAAAVWSRAPGARVPVVAIALNTSALDPNAAARAIALAAEETGLPTADPVRDDPGGADRLARAVLAASRA